MARSACSSTSISAHSSHVSPQLQGPHEVPAPVGTPFNTFRAPPGCSIEGASGRFRMQFHLHFSTPLTRVVAPLIAPPKAPVAGPAC
eukprot:7007601-Pyramimonas_sp.AAC.1